MPLSRFRLEELDRSIAQGPQLAEAAALGAFFGALFSWWTSRPLGSSVLQGVLGGALAGIATYGFDEWKSSTEHQERAHVGAVAPYPSYVPSVTYPWSEY
jgi:hypothetical protein